MLLRQAFAKGSHQSWTYPFPNPPLSNRADRSHLARVLHLSLASVREWLGGPGSEGVRKGWSHPTPPTKLQMVPPRLGSPRERYRTLRNLCGDGPESCKLSPGSPLGGVAWRRPWPGLPWGGSVRCLSSHQYPFLASPQTIRQRVG